MARPLRYVRFVPLSQHPRYGEPDYDGPRFIPPRLMCSCGNETGNVIVRDGNVIVHCQHRRRAGASYGIEDVRRYEQPCGGVLFIVGGCRTASGNPAIYYAQVTHDEIVEMERRGLDADAVMAYLNVTPYPAMQPRKSA